MQILYKEMIMASDFPLWFLITCIVVVVVLSILDALLFRTEGCVGVTSLLLGLVIFLVGTGFIMDLNEYETGRYKYEVILDDDYPASDLYGKYNIIDQRGEIWVIEDRKPEFDKKSD